MTVDWPHDERRALHARDEDPRTGRERDVGAADGEPALAGKKDVADPVQTPDAIEREDLLPDQAAVYTRSRLALVAMGKSGAHPAANQEDPGGGDDYSGHDLHGDGTGEEGGHCRSSKAAHRGEQGVERKVAELDGDQHHANDDPRNGQRDLFSSVTESTTQLLVATGEARILIAAVSQ